MSPERYSRLYSLDEKGQGVRTYAMRVRELKRFPARGSRAGCALPRPAACSNPPTFSHGRLWRAGVLTH
jgi:hypothetical protein